MSEISHFTIETCPNCASKETAIGMPERGVSGTWWCGKCRASGEIKLTVTHISVTVPVAAA